MFLMNHLCYLTANAITTVSAGPYKAMLGMSDPGGPIGSNCFDDI